MKRNLNFNIQGSQELAYQRILNYFERQGFKLSKSTKDELVFKRGNTFLNMVTFNPLQWKSNVNITISNSEVNAVFDIDTSFQAVTLKEEQLWEHFINNFKNSVLNEIDLVSINNELLKETKKNSF